MSAYCVSGHDLSRLVKALEAFGLLETTLQSAYDRLRIVNLASVHALYPALDLWELPAYHEHPFYYDTFPWDPDQGQRIRMLKTIRHYRYQSGAGTTERTWYPWVMERLEELEALILLSLPEDLQQPHHSQGCAPGHTEPAVYHSDAYAAAPWGEADGD